MDFDDIQKVWNSDKSNEVTLPGNLHKIQTARVPLDKIRKNLKKELIIQSIAVGLMGFIPFSFQFTSQMTQLFYLVYSLFAGVSIYFLYKLYVFYKRLNNTALNTKDNLYESYFDIRLAMELYKTFGFALSPFMVLFFVGYMYFRVSGSGVVDVSQLSNTVLIVLFMTLVFGVLAMGVMSEWWVQFYYGKHAKEIRAVLDKLKEE